MKDGKKFWSSEEPNLILNPRIPKEDQARIINAVKKTSQGAVVWLQSSGTESNQKGLKIVCLEKKAILIAAQSVNSFLAVKASDVWLNPLPLFHIGGLAISARCYLAGATEVLFSTWSPELFCEEIKTTQATLCSLVPTQVYDLVKNNLNSPPTLRLVLLGGGAISQETYARALDLGWPICPSYGMTETSAMVAGVNYVDFKNKEIPDLKILNHVQLIPRQNRFEIQSSGLYKGFLWVFENGEFLWDVRPTPFIIDDQIEMKRSSIRVLGRESEIVKILGETVNILSLEMKLSKTIKEPIAIQATPEERIGFKLTLFIETSENIYSLEEINKNLMPFERINEIKIKSEFPRSSTHKIIKPLLN